MSDNGEVDEEKVRVALDLKKLQTKFLETFPGCEKEFSALTYKMGRQMNGDTYWEWRIQSK